MKFIWAALAMVLAALAGLSALYPAGAEAPPTQVWAQRYTVPGQDSYVWSSRSIGVDGSGNVYVTGSSHNGLNIDMVTIKYSPAGVEQWVRRYNHTGNGNDVGWALAVDSAGNAYVTGYGYNGPDNFDMITIKYGTDGTQCWAQAYDNTSRDEKGFAIALDSSGNAYVAGSGSIATGKNDFLTVKYDGDGNQQWASYYDGLGYNNIASSIAVDAAGNAYVAGESYSGNDFDEIDYATVKYSGINGAQLWAARYDGPFSGQDSQSAIAVDTAGSLYVTGTSENASSNKYEMCTIKYSPPQADPAWVSRYIGPADFGAAAYGLALDSAGNAFVTGFCLDTEGDSSMYTVKYSTSGVLQWPAAYQGTRPGAIANAIAVDGGGNAYITGQSSNSGVGNDYTTIKYSSSGEQLWSVLYNGPANRDDKPKAIAVFGSDVYVTGQSKNAANNTDYATVKYGHESSISAVSPATAVQGQCPLTVTITGNNFLGATAVSFGTGVTVNSFTLDNLSQITAVICIGESAAAGAHTVSVTTALGTATLPAGFTVTALPGQLPAGIGTSPHSSPVVTAPTSPGPPMVNPVILAQAASLSAATVAPGTPVTVTADIANRSTVNGSKNVRVYVNGQLEASKGVEVNSGSTARVSFTVSRDEPGTYTVYVDGTDAGSFKVDRSAPDIILIVSGALVFFALVLGAVFFTRRRASY